MTEDCVKHLDNWLEKPILSFHPNDLRELFEAIKKCILHDVKKCEIEDYVMDNIKLKNSYAKNITEEDIRNMLLIVGLTYMSMLYFYKDTINYS